MRLIDADALATQIRQESTDGMFTEEVLEIIGNEPTIEAAPVVHGYWIEVFGRKYGNSLGMQCSECGRRVRNRGENYCPKCGAQMDRTEVL